MLDISLFKGEIPKLSDKLLPREYASSAINCDLDAGNLKPLKGVTSIQDVEASAETIYRLGEKWLQWGNKINIVPSFVYESGGRIVYTGDIYPKETNTALALTGGGPYPDNSRRLGISAPAAAPSYSITVTGSGADRDISYCYTIIGEWEDGTVVESAPSPPTAVFVAKDDATVQLTGFVDATGDGVYTTHYRIYRINTGNTGAEYQYVDDLDKTTSPLEYDDTVDDDDLGEVLPTTDWTTPVDDLKGITIGADGLVFGFNGNTVYVSETFIQYTFPSKYTLPVESEIVGFGYSGTALVVVTKTKPYLIFGSDPESLFVEQIPYELPGKSAESIVSLPIGVVYASVAGLILIDSGGNATNLTKEIYSKSQWESLAPENIFAFFYNDAYIAFFKDSNRGIEFKPGQNGVRIFETPEKVYGGQFVSTVSTNVYDFLTSASKNFISSDGYQFVVTGNEHSLTHDTLYLIQKKDTIREIVSWGTGSLQNYTWISKDFYITPHHILTTGMVVGDFTEGDLSLSLYIDGELSFTKTVSSQNIFRLPGKKRGSKYKIKLTGKPTVDRVVIGQSVQEILRHG